MQICLLSRLLIALLQLDVGNKLQGIDRITRQEDIRSGLEDRYIAYEVGIRVACREKEVAGYREEMIVLVANVVGSKQPC